MRAEQESREIAEDAYNELETRQTKRWPTSTELDRLPVLRGKIYEIIKDTAKRPKKVKCTGLSYNTCKILLDRYPTLESHDLQHPPERDGFAFLGKYPINYFNFNYCDYFYKKDIESIDYSIPGMRLFVSMQQIDDKVERVKPIYEKKIDKIFKKCCPGKVLLGPSALISLGVKRFLIELDELYRNEWINAGEPKDPFFGTKKSDRDKTIIKDLEYNIGLLKKLSIGPVSWNPNALRSRRRGGLSRRVPFDIEDEETPSTDDGPGIPEGVGRVPRRSPVGPVAGNYGGPCECGSDLRWDRRLELICTKCGLVYQSFDEVLPILERRLERRFPSPPSLMGRLHEMLGLASKRRRRVSSEEKLRRFRTAVWDAMDDPEWRDIGSPLPWAVMLNRTLIKKTYVSKFGHIPNSSLNDLLDLFIQTNREEAERVFRAYPDFRVDLQEYISKVIRRVFRRGA